jgi:hypothetical protein
MLSAGPATPVQVTASNYRWSGRPMAARRAAGASDMMHLRHGLPQGAVGRSTKS